MKTVSTQKMRAIYEYAETKGYKVEPLLSFSRWFKRKVIDEDKQIWIQYKLVSCLFSIGKYAMSIAITLYNKSGRIGNIEVIMPIESEQGLDRAEEQEDAIIKIAKNCGII